MKRLLAREGSRKTRGQAVPGAKHSLQHSVARAASLALFVILIPGLLAPTALTAQKREDFLQIQRDVADLGERVKALQKSQDEKFAAIQAMVQQAVDASTRVSSSIANLQREVDTKLNDQQGKLVAPVATLGTKVDQMSDEFRAVGTTVADLAKRINALDTKLADISNAIRVLNTPPPAAPAPATGQVPASPCAGISAESLLENARRDKSTGKPELAMQDYSDYVKCFSETANAPVAQFEIGQMYFSGGQYEDAVKAFDAVLERFAENPKTPEALYFKAVSLYRAEHKTEAGKGFKEYTSRYPHGEHLADAHRNLQAMGLEPKPRKR